MFQIIPAIDIIGGQCVRLQQGDYARQTVYEASPVEMALKWQTAGAPCIHLVDLDGAKTGSPCNLDTVGEICAAVDVPCELGGGIRTADSTRQALAAGVGRVILGTALVRDESLAPTLLAALEPAQLVGGIDARNGKVAVHGWQEGSDLEAVELARRLHREGVQRFIYTDIATDGMFTGTDLAGVRRLCEALPTARVIASGGVGEAGDVADLVQLGLPNLEGVIVGKALYDGRVSYAELLAAAN